MSTANNMGSRLRAILVDHDRGPEYTIVVCIDCPNQQRIDGTAGMTDAELRAKFEEMGWTIRPTRCPECVAAYRQLITTDSTPPCVDCRPEGA